MVAGFLHNGIVFSAVKNKPAYSIESVDKALLLAQLLQQHGPQRITDAAELVGVSASTAHRLLAMLVYRDFAEQLPDRRYGPGTLLQSDPATSAPTALLRRVGLPHLQDLVDATQESANLMVLAGDQVRFIATVESRQALKVGDRVGVTLQARHASGGKAALAELPPTDIDEMYAGRTDVDLTRLHHDLGLIRKRGFAINDQATEKGLTAIGVAVHDQDGRPNAAISLALPSARFSRDRLSDWVEALIVTRNRVERDLRRAAEREES
jgi:IclR family transcriptional regulator, acetate operon repressor